MKKRLKTLNQIFEYFEQITQWLPDSIENAAQYMFMAQSLIEFLEVEDCGSVGGYDKKSPVKHESGFTLYDRFLALVRKYKNGKDIKSGTYFNIYTLKDYFLKLSELREAYNPDTDF